MKKTIIVGGNITVKDSEPDKCTITIQDHKKQNFQFVMLDSNAEKVSKWEVGKFIIAKIYAVKMETKEELWRVNIILEYKNKSVRYHTYWKTMPTLNKKEKT